MEVIFFQKKLIDCGFRMRGGVEILLEQFVFNEIRRFFVFPVMMGHGKGRGIVTISFPPEACLK